MSTTRNIIGIIGTLFLGAYLGAACLNAARLLGAGL